MRCALRFLAAFVFLLAANDAFAWGPLGHQIIAGIAARELTPAARVRISDLLGGRAEAMMVLNSSWADEIRSDRPQTSAWHFVNIPLGSVGYQPRYCFKDDCVVAQISRQGRILSDPRASKPAKTEALRFLIHLVGDVHQPLHVADKNDRGGNDTMLRFRGQRRSLHAIWDQAVVEPLGRDSECIAAEIETHLTMQQRMQIGGGTPTDWANEGFALAQKEIYAKLPARSAENYARAQSGLARLQLTRAGVRLGALLNRLIAG